MWKRRLILALAALVLPAGAAAARSILVQPGPRPDPDAEVAWLATCAVDDATGERSCTLGGRLQGPAASDWMHVGIEITERETAVRVNAGGGGEAGFATAWLTAGHEGGVRTDDCEALGCSVTGDAAEELVTDMVYGAGAPDGGMFREDVLHIRIATGEGGERRADLSLETFLPQYEAAWDWIRQEAGEPSAQLVAAAASTCQRDTTMEIVACLDGELATAEARLETVYDELLVEFSREIRESAALTPVDSETRIRTLVDAQAAWRAFVEANCRVQYERAMGGSIAGIWHLTCKVDATRARIAELEGFWAF